MAGYRRYQGIVLQIRLKGDLAADRLQARAAGLFEFICD
jgi:hypothetical protein